MEECRNCGAKALFEGQKVCHECKKQYRKDWQIEFTTNFGRILRNATFLTEFAAFCEVIDNSIQADATNVKVKMETAGKDILACLVLGATALCASSMTMRPILFLMWANADSSFLRAAIILENPPTMNMDLSNGAGIGCLPQNLTALRGLLARCCQTSTKHSKDCSQSSSVWAIHSTTYPSGWVLS